MSQLPYPYQLEPYSYRVVPYSPVAQYGARYNPYPIPPHDYYYQPAAPPPPPYVGPDRAYSRPRGGRPTLSEDQRLENLRERLINDEPAADLHLPHRPVPAAAAAKPPAPEAEAAPEVVPPPLPPPQEETFATGITPYKELHYPAKLHRERKAKLHARNDKPSTSRSPYTVFVIIHEVNGVNIDVQVSDDLQDANTEVLRIMARYHPQTFKLLRLRKKAINASSGENPENENDKNGDNTGGGVKTEAEQDEDMGAGDDDAPSTDKGQERERRFVYLGDWKFVHSGTLKLEAKQGNQVIKISSALKNVRHERKDPKQAKREKRRGTAMAGGGLAEV
ncbi:hypothetical protein PG989_004801 [Apiospora arundinis]